MTPFDFHIAMMAYCAAASASETSGYRTRKHNNNVGGHVHSAHQVWLARDVVYDEAPDIAYRYALAQRLGLEIIIEDDHDHLQAPKRRI